MTTCVLETLNDKEHFKRFLDRQRLPCTVSCHDGRRASPEQKRTQFKWLNEAAVQMEDRTSEELRAECKLMGAVPIICGEDDVYREAYERVIGCLPYEHKISMMSKPIDYPVTRFMTSRQMSLYLDWMWDRFTEQGIVLTKPKKRR